MDRRFPKQQFEVENFADFFQDDLTNIKVEFFDSGACNSNYLVSTSQKGKVVCRVHSRSNPQVEAYITNLVQGVIPTPTFLWTSHDSSVMSYVQGEEFQPTPKLVKEAGVLIAKMSRIKFDNKGYFLSDGSIKAFDGWESTQAGILNLINHEMVKKILPTSLNVKLIKVIQTYEEILNSFDRCRNLVHGDFRPDNILVKNDNVAAVIDWEFSHSGCSYMDIGNIMRHIPDKWTKYLEDGLIEGGFDLDEDWLFRAKLIDLISHLEFLTSDRSQKFKKSCVDKIKEFVDFEQKVSSNLNGFN